MTRKILLGIVALCSVAVAAASDLKYTQKAMGFSSTIYVKGKQERRDMNMMGMDVSTILSCPKKQTITLNNKCKLYYITPMDENAPAMTMPAGGPGMGRGGPPRQGGLVVVESEIRDTGERQQMFGMTARHIMMKMSMDAKEGSCHPGQTNMEMDEWVVDIANAQVSCAVKPTAAPPMMPPARGGCQDKYEMKSKGSAMTAKQGFPVKLSMGQMTMEVTDLSTATLDQSVFEIPAGYKQASSEQEVHSCGMGIGSMMGAMKQAQRQQEQAQGEGSGGSHDRSGSGLPRIGVVSSENSSGPEANSLSDQLVENIQATQQFDAVRIDATTPDDIQKEAAEKKCEFVLYNNVVEAGTKGPKIGGLLGRAAGIGHGSLMPTQTIRSEYRLTLVKPFGQEVSKDNLNQSEQAESMDQVAGSLMSKMATRAVADSARWKREHR